MTYAYLAEGRDEQQLLELEMALAPTPEAKQETIDKQNMEAMRQLRSMMDGMQQPRRR